VSGAKPLRADLVGHYRLRVGDWRIVFRVQGQDVIVVRIAHRKEIYED
jgi:mRNA interferase RelE/StbE